MFYRNKRAINFPNFEALKRIGLTDVYSKNIVYLYLFLFIMFILIVALAGMKIQFDANTSDYSYVMAIDNSDSMRASDLEPNRLEVSKTTAKNFISNLPIGVKVGVVSFSGDVNILSPLDDSKFGPMGVIDTIEFSDVSGTNLGDAVIAGNELLKKQKLKSMIVISDGQINLGNLSDIIEYAQENEIVVNTIAIGTLGGGDTGNGFISKVDNNALKSLAFNTDGRAFNVNNSRDMALSFDELLNNTHKEVEFRISNYLLILSLILITLYWLVYNFRFKNFP